MAEKNMIIEDARKRFSQIMEYTSFGNSQFEADDKNSDNNGGDQGGMPPAPDGAGMGGDPNAMGGDPSMGGDPNAMGGDPNAMGGDQGQGGPQGFNPQVDQTNGGDMSAQDFDSPGPDDDVVDVSELTDSEKETQHEVEKMDNKFGKVMKYLGAFEELLRSNEEKIEDLKAEFEKRNPTQVEKLSMQTAKSYPFSDTPAEYWKNKEATSNYSTEDDDNGKEQGQYVITDKDVNGQVDWKSIADSLDDDDFLYNQTLNGVLKI